MHGNGYVLWEMQKSPQMLGSLNEPKYCFAFLSIFFPAEHFQIISKVHPELEFVLLWPL